MRIAIVGAGAVGGYLAARLARAGRDVAVLARGEHLAAIRGKGLTLETPDERFTVRLDASDDPAKLGPADAVLITSKVTAHRALVPRIAPLLGAETPVVLTQNGVFFWYGQGFAPGGKVLDTSRLDPDGLIARSVAPERTMGMIINSPNEVIAPGVVHNGSTKNRFTIGEPDGSSSPRLAALAEAFTGCGFALDVTNEIRKEMWKKLLSNMSSAPIALLSRTTSDVTVGDPDTRAIMRALVLEGMAVAAAHGFADLGLDPDAMTAPGSKTRHKPSILQDLELGRPLELDSMLLIVQDFARQASVPTPTLDLCMALVVALARQSGVYPPAAQAA